MTHRTMRSALPTCLSVDATVKAGRISVERWSAYRDNRNNTAHDYGEGVVKETLVLLPGFIADAKLLEIALRDRFNNEA